MKRLGILRSAASNSVFSADLAWKVSDFASAEFRISSMSLNFSNNVVSASGGVDTRMGYDCIKRTKWG